ncbi:MAG: alpha/beta hydrolase, partial [Casimicrobiaceae bacterium]
MWRVVVIAVAIAVVAYVRFERKPGVVETVFDAPIAADAKAFTLGRLSFTACELPRKRSGATTRAFCAPFTVPENRADPDGRKLNLRLALIRSDALAADRDIVVYLAGGPG